MATTEKVLRSGDRNHVIHVTADGVSNATATELVDLSEVFPAKGNIAAAGKVKVEKVEYSVWGHPEVRLFWDFSTDEEICHLQGQDCIDWRCVGGNAPSKSTASGTGDIYLQTATQGAAGLQESGYDITIHCKR